MLDLLELKSRYWNDFFVPSFNPYHKPTTIMVHDLDTVSKTWTYLFHHYLEINCSSSDLIAIRALGVYMLLTQRNVNIVQIISIDMDVMA